MSDVLKWTPTRLSRTYIHELCGDTECSLEELPRAMDNRDRLPERERERERKRES